MPNHSRGLSCGYCNETFQRNGHLQRHLLRHSGVRAFACAVCKKSFPRNDTLLRHEATHGKHHSQRANSGRVPRACVPCGQAKQRCSGGNPCVRCERRRFNCEYGAEQARRPRSSVSRTSDPTESGSLPESLAAQESTSIFPASPTNLDSEPTLDGLNPQAEATVPPVHLSTTHTSTSPSLEGVNHTSWSHLLDLPEAINTEYDMFTSYLPHEMLLPDEMTQNPGFPFLWMTEGLGSFSPTQDTLDQGLPNLITSNDEGVVASGMTKCIDPRGHVAEHHADINFREARLPGGCDYAYVLLPDVCPIFPSLSEEDLQSASVEIFDYVREVPRAAYAALRAFYVSSRGFDDVSFPDCKLIHSFVELYFEYFDPHLPFLHPTRIDADNLSWILLLAVSFVGGQYSEVKDASSFTAVLKYLLRRAVQTNTGAGTTDISLAQILLLQNVGLDFSGLMADQAVVHHEKNTLVALCRRLATSASLRDASEATIYPDQDQNQEWLVWLKGEEIVRLLYCVYLMECFDVVFYDWRPLFRLTDLTHRLPCKREVWRSCNAKQWIEESQRRNLQDETRTSRSFSTRSNIMNLYVDERAILDHIQSSRRLRALIRPGMDQRPEEKDTYSARQKLLLFGGSKEDITFLDEMIENAISSASCSHSDIECSRADPIIHVVAIIREVPLRMIHASVGWQANGAEMQRYKENLKEYLNHNRSIARTCLWHAARIYSSLRNPRLAAYYSSLSFTIAASYILLYNDVVPCLSLQGDILRLEKLEETPRVEAWIRCAEDFQIHIKGIGILGTTQSSQRLLVDAEKVMRSQKPWRSLAQILAHCFVQLGRGERPRTVEN